MFMKRYVIGDIHGCHEALKQVFNRSSFDFKKDKLIVLGDTCDGWPFVKQCFDELLKVKELICVLGNHDLWAYKWYTGKMGSTSVDYYLWTQQGGQATLDSYSNQDMDSQHIDLIRNALPYHIENNNLFVHGGISEYIPIEKQKLNKFIWDRDMWEKAVMVHPINNDYKFGEWETIFIGHSQTWNYSNVTLPMKRCNVMNLDTGAGWSGKLTLMDIDSREFWQSDIVRELYPNIKGRK